MKELNERIESLENEIEQLHYFMLSLTDDPETLDYIKGLIAGHKKPEFGFIGD